MSEEERPCLSGAELFRYLSWLRQNPEENEEAWTIVKKTGERLCQGQLTAGEIADGDRLEAFAVEWCEENQV